MPENQAGRKRRSTLERKRRERWMILAAALAIVLLPGAFFVFLLFTSGGQPVVPDVVGLTYGEARRRASQAGLKVRISYLHETRGADNLQGLTVKRQNPEDGTSLAEGMAIAVELEGLPYKSELRREDAGQEASPEAESVPTKPPAPPVQPASPSVIPPVQGALLYPFTRDASIACGHWPSGSQDYPFFGAPRDGNSRKHAGVDLYPTTGIGSAVFAMKDGAILKVAPFYTRADGEVTYGVLVDHGDIVANYAELRAPSVQAGDEVRQGQALGVISGTRQLHLEVYKGGTRDWVHGWYGNQPANLLDPTDMMLGLF